MLTLVVCTKGRTRQLERLLRSLQRQSDPRFEVLVVDQNPPGFLADVLVAGDGLALRHLASAPGVSHGRNLGLGHVRTPLVAFTDDDCWYPPGLVADVIRRFEAEPDLAVLAGRTVDAAFNESVAPHLASSRRLARRDAFHAGTTSAFFARTAAATAVGGFDETLGVGAGTIFGAGEETDFLLKCLGRGALVRYDSDLLVHHDQVARDDGKIVSYATGIGRVCRTHNLGAAFLAPRVARAALRSLTLRATGDAGGARARWLWIKGSLKGFFAERGGWHATAAGVRHSGGEPRDEGSRRRDRPPG